MTDYRLAARTLYPQVRFHWKGEISGPDTEDYSNIGEWDEDGLGVPKPTAAELDAHWIDWIAAHPIIGPEVLDAIQAAAKENVKTIPGWARWTVEEAGDWYAANVSDLLPVANLAEANELLANMATAQWAEIQMLLEIRNRLWPELEAGGE